MSLFTVFNAVVQLAHKRWIWSLWSLYPLMVLVSLTVGSRSQALIICEKIISRSRQAILRDLQLSTSYTSTGWSVAFSTLLSFTKLFSHVLHDFSSFCWRPPAAELSSHQSFTTFLPWLNSSTRARASHVTVLVVWLLPCKGALPSGHAGATTAENHQCTQERVPLTLFQHLRYTDSNETPAFKPSE